MKHPKWLLPLVVVALACGPTALASHHDEGEVVKAAKAWLELVDTGDYGAGWEETATMLKRAISKEHFIDSLAPVRGPLGAVVSRNLKSTEYHTELPAAPDGEYLIIQFDTEFENKRNAVETVTPMLDEDGT